MPTLLAAVNPLDATSVIAATGLLGIFCVLVAGTGLLIGFFLPGDSLLFSAGLLAASPGSLHLPLGWVLVVAAAGALAGAAATVGAQFVLTSVLDATPHSGFDLSRAKYAAEQHLRAPSINWTIVRAGPFLETWLDILTQTAGKSSRPLIFGRGERAIGFVSMIDVAALIIRAGTEELLRGQTLEVAGTPMTMTELAQTLQTACGWRGPARHLARPLVRALGTLARPVNTAFARKNRAALLMDTSTLAATTDLTRLLGRRPTQVADILATLGREDQT